MIFDEVDEAGAVGGDEFRELRGGLGVLVAADAGWDEAAKGKLCFEEGHVGKRRRAGRAQERDGDFVVFRRQGGQRRLHDGGLHVGRGGPRGVDHEDRSCLPSFSGRRRDADRRQRSLVVFRHHAPAAVLQQGHHHGVGPAEPGVRRHLGVDGLRQRGLALGELGALRHLGQLTRLTTLLGAPLLLGLRQPRRRLLFLWGRLPLLRRPPHRRLEGLALGLWF
mmetsp:Transcript_32720/g.104299  ORF Transcript_32720/g.104299 Transcript_32720/m.104299 type:complete len:222 (-) Transcript_32720:179-844(-)